MKCLKRALPAIVLAVAVLMMSVYTIVSCIAMKPTVTEGEFPFSITYEIDGKTVTIDDVYKAHYVKNGGYADTKSREYVGGIAGLGENETVYTLKKDEHTRVELCTHFYADHLMGDSEGDYFDDEAFEPRVYYYDAEEIEYSDEETLAAQGVKLIRFEYPTPIENAFVFSHISYCSSAVVLPILGIALLALIAILIFVKKETALKRNAADVVSIILNVVVGVLFLPFVTIAALLIDMNGGGPELYYQILYFIPAFSTLAIAAAVALRRKGHCVKSLLVSLLGPVVFVLYLIVFYVTESI